MDCKDFFHPLLNIHILEKVFSYLSPRTLLLCRIVCTTWNNESLRTLEKKDIAAVIKGDGNQISHFCDVIEKSENHPYRSFTLEIPKEGSLDGLVGKSVTRLLELLKDCMTQLRLEYEMPAALPTEVLTSDPGLDINLSELENASKDFYDEAKGTISLSKLKVLHVFATNIFPPRSPHTFPLFIQVLRTPLLSSLSFQHLYPIGCAEIVTTLINSSGSVISNLRISCTEFPKIVESVNLKKLKELDICDLFHGSYATNDTLKCIQKYCPNLEHLSIELGCRVTFDKVYRLLETLRHSLRYLKLIIQDKNLLSRNIQTTRFNFPSLPLLRSLFLRFSNPGLVYYIEELPLLNSLELETPWTRKIRGHLFPGLDVKVYDSITLLNFTEKLTLEDIKTAHQLFPNLKCLCASFKSDMSLLQTFEHFDRLESLIIDRNSEITDFGICGLENEDLNIFSDTFSNENFDYENDRDIIADSKLKIFNGIARLQRLKVLKLVKVGLSWKAIVVGVCKLKNLRSLAVQGTSLRINNESLISNGKVIETMNKSLPKLSCLSIWIRRNSERLSEEELQYLKNNYPDWNVEIILQAMTNTM